MAPKYLRNPESDIRSRHLTFSRYPTFKTLKATTKEERERKRQYLPLYLLLPLSLSSPLSSFSSGQLRSLPNTSNYAQQRFRAATLINELDQLRSSTISSSYARQRIWALTLVSNLEHLRSSAVSSSYAHQQSRVVMLVNSFRGL